MNRSLARWLADNPGGAVVLTGLLGLLPLLGLGFAFFLPGAVPALVTLVRGPRLGLIVALGGSGLLAASMLVFGRPMAVGFIYSVWVLGPPVALAVLLARTESLALCLQLATLVGALVLVALHVAFGDPERFWAPFVRDLAAEMQRHGLPTEMFEKGLAETLARTLWGWVVVLTALLAMCALFLARWWQSLLAQTGAFGAEFVALRLGRALGIAAAVIVGWSLLVQFVHTAAMVFDAAPLTTLAQFDAPALVDDISRLFLGALVIVGLAAAHRAVANGRFAPVWLWVTYAALLLVAPLAVIVLAAWGFVHNWFWSQRVATPVGRH